MDIIDLNWEKCEEICRETLDRVESRILSDETENRSENYWALMKRLHKEYNADIGEFLCSLASSNMSYLKGTTSDPTHYVHTYIRYTHSLRTFNWKRHYRFECVIKKYAIF